MTLKPVHKLAHYRLVEKIGEGGMGVVWKAVDSKLDREVAIKILPDELSRNAERLERFQREAKAIAALNHPNIITIHSIEEHDGHRFLVMELVEGDSLDRLIRPGGLPLSQVFEVAIRIVEIETKDHKLLGEFIRSVEAGSESHEQEAPAQLPLETVGAKQK